jgi:hypothetical protein
MAARGIFARSRKNVQRDRPSRVTSVLGGLKSWRGGRLARLGAIGHFCPAYQGPRRPWRWAGPNGGHSLSAVSCIVCIAIPSVLERAHQFVRPGFAFRRFLAKHLAPRAMNVVTQVVACAVAEAGLEPVRAMKLPGFQNARRLRESAFGKGICEVLRRSVVSEVVSDAITNPVSMA